MRRTSIGIASMLGTLFAPPSLGRSGDEDRLEIHDLHATFLHLLGIDHERLTYRFSGRDIRRTDVYGNVVHDLLA